jgi:hypothetical protein
VVYSPKMTSEQFGAIRPADLLRIDPRQVTDLHLVYLYRSLSAYRAWTEAGAALDELSRREGDAGSLDAAGHRYDLLHDLLDHGATDEARRQAERIPEEFLTPLDRYALGHLLEPGESLTDLEDLLRGALSRSDGEALADLAYQVLPLCPALGIAIAHSAFVAKGTSDDWDLLNCVEEARDRLLLPPGDPAWDLPEYDAGFVEEEAPSDRVALEEAREELDGVRKLAREEAARNREYLRQVRALEEELRAAKGRESKARDLAAESREAGERVDDLLRRHRELKTLLKASNHERAQLRKKLSGVSRRLADAKEEDAVEPEADPEEAPARMPERMAPVLPSFADRFEASFAAAPPDVGRIALRAVGGLSGADAAAWAGAKRMKATPDVLSVRVGRSHRLLFRAGSDTKRLEILELVARRDLEAALRRYR